jgi:type I restriction enzyme, S subunit
LGEVVDPVPLTGLKLPQGQYEVTGSLPVIDQGQKLVGDYTNREDLRIRVARPVIVFGDHTKAIKYVDFDFVAGADGIKPLVPWEVFFPKLFYYFLLALRLPDKGYARHFQFLVKSSMPIPPFPEQRRIVAKIEELFSQLDAGVEELKKAKAQLKRYRQSVLKAAFEGKLTEEWRRQRANRQEPLETAKELLEHIKKERQQAAANSHRTYKEPPPLDTSALPELPQGWAWARLGDLSWDSGYGTSDRCTYDGAGAPVLRIPNVVDGRVDLGDLKHAVQAFQPSKDEELVPGDVLIIRTNGSRDLIGRMALVRQAFPRPHYFASYLIRFRLMGYGPLPAWVATMWNSAFVRDWIEREAATSAGQYNISMRVLERLPLSVPPSTEQRAACSEVERRLSVADAEEKSIEAALKQAARLRQSILKRAFEGRLVPQDPSDEPADRLLERIRAEKVKREAGQPRGRGRRAIR